MTEHVSMGLVERWLENLSRWRHLPGYRLEPRVDALIALFLPKWIEARPGWGAVRLVPEFPLRRGLLYGEGTKGPNQSKQVDFLVIDPVGRRALLVEVKTDPGSRNETQDRYLVLAQEAGLERLVEHALLVAAATASKYRTKYRYLIRELAGLGLVRLPDAGLPVSGRGWKEGLRQTRVEAKGFSLGVLYVQPSREEGDEEEEVLDFEALASSIEGSCCDRESQALARHLRGWRAPAGGER